MNSSICPCRISWSQFARRWTHIFWTGLQRQPLSREWFLEQRDGNCRLMGSFAARLSQTAPTWGRAVAPFAEWVARAIWSTIRRPETCSPHASRRPTNGKLGGAHQFHRPNPHHSRRTFVAFVGCRFPPGEAIVPCVTLLPLASESWRLPRWDE